MIFKQEEVASCLCLVGRFGLKATPAYNPTACIHRNFQSDNRIVSRTNARNPPLWRVFALVIGGRSGLTRDCEAIGKYGIDIAEREKHGGGDVVSREARDNLFSGTIYLKASFTGVFYYVNQASRKVRLCRSRKQHFYQNYRTFKVRANKNKEL